MIERGGRVIIRMLENVRQKTIEPVITKLVERSQLYTNEYNIYNRLEAWGYQHKRVNHSAKEYARDDDGDGCEHVITVEGFRSLLRSWLRPHRGSSQELPLYLSSFDFVHNARARGRALLPPLLELLLDT